MKRLFENFEKWDWFILSLSLSLGVVCIFTTWKALILTWPIYGLGELGDFIKRRRQRSW